MATLGERQEAKLEAVRPDLEIEDFDFQKLGKRLIAAVRRISNLDENQRARVLKRLADT